MNTFFLIDRLNKQPKVSAGTTYFIKDMSFQIPLQLEIKGDFSLNRQTKNNHLYDILFTTSDTLQTITHFPILRTLHGIVIFQSFLPWIKSIHLGFYDQDYEKIKSLKDVFKKHNFNLYKVKNGFVIQHSTYLSICLYLLPQPHCELMDTKCCGRLIKIPKNSELLLKEIYGPRALLEIEDSEDNLKKEKRFNTFNVHWLGL